MDSSDQLSEIFEDSVQARIPFLDVIPWLFLVSSDITAAVHDGKNQHAIRFKTVHYAIALHNNFSYRFIVSFWNQPTAFQKDFSRRVASTIFWPKRRA